MKKEAIFEIQFLPGCPTVSIVWCKLKLNKLIKHNISMKKLINI